MSNWRRVTKASPCPICGKPDLCTIAPDAATVKCCRVSEGAYKTGEDGAGIYHCHRMTDQRRPAVLPAPVPKAPTIDAASFAMRYQGRIQTSQIDALARMLGVSPDSLRRLRIGWSGRHRAFSFPMVDGEGLIVGIRLRNTEGRKWAVTGSHAGIFVPRDLTGEGPLFVVEGPTDCAAMLTLGFDVIGRPSDTAGTEIIATFIQRQPRHVVIALERNRPCSTADINARRGAETLRDRIRTTALSVTVMQPPAKDVRDWLIQGADQQAVMTECRIAYRKQRVYDQTVSRMNLGKNRGTQSRSRIGQAGRRNEAARSEQAGSAGTQTRATSHP